MMASSGTMASCRKLHTDPEQGPEQQFYALVLTNPQQHTFDIAVTDGINAWNGTGKSCWSSGPTAGSFHSPLCACLTPLCGHQAPQQSSSQHQAPPPQHPQPQKSLQLFFTTAYINDSMEWHHAGIT